ncbi:hypothetical protein QTJ16_000877 [Diplocarpon rosae]|uniref:AB hydrolase-1 domain-containing protein n=1 Tax=Diplocarpon rosae TaxID=946125 RepID=A0AAD9T6P8_9HELO|nr:hypothetical protein QTJ16_000877 [Diplocarpon rosae]
MDSNSRLLSGHEAGGARRRRRRGSHDRDQCGTVTIREYVKAQRWHWWLRLLLIVVGAASLSYGEKSTRKTFNCWDPWGASSEEKAAGWRWSEVPLDWLDPSDTRRTAIAVIRYNATDLTSYAGPVFINPGGPSGSGIWFVKHLAPYYQSVVGRNHHIISFYFRGVGFITPQISCWNNTTPSSISYLWDLTEPPVLDAHSGIIYDSYAHASALSIQCASHIAAMGQFVGTASVARDMLHMLEKMHIQKLKYWGFSYGTFLGVTFASLFPERVGRIVNDGNVDAKDYVSGTATHFLTDTDQVMNSFNVFCHQAGPDLCVFYASSPEAIEARLDALLMRIKTHPVIVPASPSSNLRPEIVSYSRLRRSISSSLYRPLVVFPNLASTLLALESGDGRPFIELTWQGSEELPLCDARLDNQVPTDPESPTPEVPEAEGMRMQENPFYAAIGTA